MDKHTAIDLLDNLLGMVEDNHGSDYDTAIKMGIDAIKALPTAQPESCNKLATDCIDRKAAIDAFEERLKTNGYSNAALVSELNRCIGYLMQLPSVQPERMTNRQWVDFLSAQFDISRTSAKEMLHGKKKKKKEDNFKKLFNGGKT